MSARAWSCVAAWAALAALGWLTGTWAFAAVAGLALLPLPFLLAAARREPADPFDPLWPLSALFAFTYLLVPPLESIDASRFLSLPGYLELPPAQLQFATLTSGAAFLALLYGYFGPIGGWVARRLPSLRSQPGELQTGVLAAVLFVLGGAALVAATALSDVGLSLDAIANGDLRRGVLSSFGGRGYLSVGLNALALSAPVATYWLSMNVRRGRIVLVALASIVAFALLAGVAGSRLLALQIPLAIAVVVHYRIFRLRIAHAAIGAALVLVAGIAILAGRSGTSFWSPLSAAGALSLTFDGFNYLTTALARTPDLLLGRSLLEDAAYTYLPRAIWHGKPVVYGMVTAQEAVVPGLARDAGGAGTATYPVGLVAEGYVNFAIAGALALPALAGTAFRAIRELAVPAAPIFLLLLAWLLPNTLSVMRGVGPTIPAAAVTLLLLSPLAVPWPPLRRKR